MGERDDPEYWVNLGKNTETGMVLNDYYAPHTGQTPYYGDDSKVCEFIEAEVTSRTMTRLANKFRDAPICSDLIEKEY